MKIPHDELNNYWFVLPSCKLKPTDKVFVYHWLELTTGKTGTSTICHLSTAHFYAAMANWNRTSGLTSTRKWVYWTEKYYE